MTVVDLLEEGRAVDPHKCAVDDGETSTQFSLESNYHDEFYFANKAIVSIFIVIFVFMITVAISTIIIVIVVHDCVVVVYGLYSINDCLLPSFRTYIRRAAPNSEHHRKETVAFSSEYSSILCFLWLFILFLYPLFLSFPFSSPQAHKLIRLGVRPEQTVGVCIHRNAMCVCAILGIAKAGAAYVLKGIASSVLI